MNSKSVCSKDGSVNGESVCRESGNTNGESVAKIKCHNVNDENSCIKDTCRTLINGVFFCFVFSPSEDDNVNGESCCSKGGNITGEVGSSGVSTPRGSLCQPC